MSQSPAGATAAGLPSFLASIWDSDDPRAARAIPRIWGFSLLFAQLVALVWVVRAFRIEERAFLTMMGVATGGFFVHYWLPFRLKEPFWILTSLGGAALMLGVDTFLVLLFAGLVFYALLASGLSYRVKVVVMLALSVLLMAGRAIEVAGIPAAVWPVLGALFMFRMIVYLYDLRQAKQRPPLQEFLAYFYPLPNFYFLLFPVVDLQTQRRTYYQRDIHVVAQQGLLWMVRGVVQLMLYRLVYFLKPSFTPEGVTSFGTLAAAMIGTYLLYLRVSGQFHMIVGLMHLFGYDLPETHRKYLLSSSITDFWRRINIYWKDFMVKVVYFPVYFRYRKSGDMRARVIATVVVFVTTWALHSYQWFWLRGELLLTWTDTLFWAMLAALVVGNLVLEQRAARKDKTPGAAAAAGDGLVMQVRQGLKVAGTLDAHRRPVVVLAVADHRRLDHHGGVVEPVAVPGMFERLFDPAHRERQICVVMLAVLLALTLVPPAFFRYHPREDTALKKVFRTVQKRGLNRDAAAQQTAGYYEGLLDGAAGIAGVGGAGGRGWLDWEFWSGQRAARQNPERAQRQERPDYLRYALQPNLDVPDLDEKRRIVTNSHGMPDKEYTVAKPERAWRIGLIGDSVTQGIGTTFGNTYEARLERHLNETFTGGAHGLYEVLNFGVRGYQMTQFVDVGLHTVPRFDPDVYVVGLTVRSVYRSWADHLASLVRNRVDMKYQYLRQLVDEAEIAPNMTEALINARLAPYRLRVMKWALQELQAQARRDGVPLLVLLLPVADDTELQMEEFEGVRTVLAELSIPTLDLLDTFVELDDLDPVRVSSGDRHPNDDGHRMLFEALVRKLEGDEGLLAAFTGTSAPAVGSIPQR